jgi:hypothetical protein
MKEAIGRMKEIAYLAKKHEWDEDVTVKIQLHHVFSVLDFYERHKDENEPSLKPKEEAESDENAALIASAPEMLELLQTIIEEDWLKGYNIEDVARKIVEKATTPI